MISHAGRARVAVTGAGGFIGSYVVATLEAAGCSVRALLGPPAMPAHPDLPRPREAYADICDAPAIARLVRDVDLVVHLAGPPSVSESLRDPAGFVRAHVEGTACVLQACREANVTRLVYLSSAEVYGRPETDFVGEEHPLGARSPYGAAKIGAEALIAAFAAAYELAAVVLRPFSVYGPGAPAQSLLSELVRALRTSGPASVRDLRPVRDYVFVGDLAAAVVAAAKFVSDPGVLCCNVGTMRGISVAELWNLLATIGDSHALISEVPRERRPGASDLMRLVADNTRARDALGWVPVTPLEEGLRITMESLSLV